MSISKTHTQNRGFIHTFSARHHAKPPRRHPGQVCIKVLEIIMAQKTFLRGCLVRDGRGCSIAVTAILQ